MVSDGEQFWYYNSTESMYVRQAAELPPGVDEKKNGNDRDSLLYVFDGEPGYRFGGVLCPKTGAILELSR